MHSRVGLLQVVDLLGVAAAASVSLLALQKGVVHESAKDEVERGSDPFAHRSIERGQRSVLVCGSQCGL